MILIEVLRSNRTRNGLISTFGAKGYIGVKKRDNRYSASLFVPSSGIGLNSWAIYSTVWSLFLWKVKD